MTDCPPGFLKLDRRFVEIREADTTEESAFHGYLGEAEGRDHGLGWSEVLTDPAVVILGEPGSGKTWEMRCCTASLKADGQPAFFVRLDELVDHPLEQALSPEDAGTFEKWTFGSQAATFFLDSVDEAKLRRHEAFSLALNSFFRGVTARKHAQLRIVVSPRITEWRWASDRHEIERQLHYLVLPRKIKDGADDRRRARLKVCQLAPLDRGQVRRLAAAMGLVNPDSFLAALDYHHAWEFAGRPSDVSDLAAFWQDHGRLGALTELVEHNIHASLARRQGDSAGILSRLSRCTKAPLRLRLRSCSVGGRMSSYPTPAQAKSIPMQ